MRAIDADAIKYTMIYRENWMRGTGGEEQAAWKSTIDAMPTIEPERKKGKWVKVSGYATPGGDPTWCCSECGKGLHVYGIEHGTYGADVSDGQWVACPNCGAVMEEL